MKIAVISIGSFDTQYSDYHIMRDIVLNFLRNGHKILLVQKQYLPEAIIPEQFIPYIDTEFLCIHNIEFKKTEKSNLKARYFADLLYYFKACIYLIGKSIDCIFLQSNNTGFVPVFFSKHILKVPLLYNEMDIFPDNAKISGLISEKSLLFRAAHALQKYVYSNATDLVTISDDMSTTIHDQYGIPADKIHVIYNWGHQKSESIIDDENMFLQKHPPKCQEYRVIYAGNLGNMQNVEMIIKCADILKNNKDIRFYIIGNGSDEALLKAQAIHLSLNNIIFMDMQPPEYALDIYSSADINVITLKKGIIYAALPSKIADCLLAGKPIITCFDKCSKTSKIFSKYEIPVVEPDDNEELAKTIISIKNGAWIGLSGNMYDSLFSYNNVCKYSTIIENYGS